MRDRARRDRWRLQLVTRRFRELLPTLLTIALLLVMERTRLPLLPGPVLAMAVAYTAFRGGTSSGLLSAAISLVYVLWFNGTRAQHLDAHTLNIIRISVNF